MKKLVLTAVLVSVAAFAQERGGADAIHVPGPADSHAEAAAKQGEAHAPEHAMPNEILWKWANFAILAGVLGWLISKHAGGFFRSRTEAIQAGIAEATRVRQDAEARAADIERRVSRLETEISELRHQSREEISREGERIRADTEAQIRKIQAQAEAEIAAAARHAAHDLKAYSAQLAMQLAEGQIRQRMTPSAHDAVVSSFVTELRGKAEHN